MGIILYGFRLTFQDVVAVGTAGIVVDLIIVTLTILGGVWIGKMLKMDKETALLTSIGSSICGAAAVLGAEATIRTKPDKTAVTVATVYPATLIHGETCRNSLSNIRAPQKATAVWPEGKPWLSVRSGRISLMVCFNR